MDALVYVVMPGLWGSQPTDEGLKHIRTPLPAKTLCLFFGAKRNPSNRCRTLLDENLTAGNYSLYHRQNIWYNKNGIWPGSSGGCPAGFSLFKQDFPLVRVHIFAPEPVSRKPALFLAIAHENSRSFQYELKIKYHPAKGTNPKTWFLIPNSFFAGVPHENFRSRY